MPFVLALVDDLMFLSRIGEAARAAQVEVRRVRQVAELLEAARQEPRLVLVDLDSPRLPVQDALRALRADPEAARAPVIGFFSHVHVERAQAARDAGCGRVLPRGAFVRELPALLGATPAAS